MLKCGPVTETGWSVSVEKTHNEQVASNPIPCTSDGEMLCSVRARRTTEQTWCQMSVVDCSFNSLARFMSIGGGYHGEVSYIVPVLGLP